MPAYAIGNLHGVDVGADIIAYLERIDDTLAPFGGRFLVHGSGSPTVLEGSWDGDLIVIEFPSLDAAQRWYDSDTYQTILPLRTDNAQGTVMLVQGVDQSYRARGLA